MKLRSISVLAALLIVTLSMAMARPKIHKTVYVAEPTVVGRSRDGTRNLHHRLERNQPQRSGQFLASRQNDCGGSGNACAGKESIRFPNHVADPGCKKSLVEIRLTNSTLDFVQGDARSGN